MRWTKGGRDLTVGRRIRMAPASIIPAKMDVTAGTSTVGLEDAVAAAHAIKV
ncbi:hypothetical protein [Salipiger mangrovisoli]|uniref:Uncharacterized protein n=1 Tax=Salipiger mangrovisoli TaxID=2865933 RepID=A0ABR9X1I1_9RHOB|nr:hypothetical protein [Salipiger mangrovisoli]MBE9637420.1 hypothetical protein [Salipiger mangrovisoli]